MSRSHSVTEATDVRGAVRFFWGWLLVATSASVAANVTHAVLTAPHQTAALAAAAAVVPPAVLLGATHSVALLVKARRSGPSYWSALGMTLMLAACAFVLSFDALTDLAKSLGMTADRAWLWPCAIDVSIAQSTLALLSLAGPARVHRAASTNPAPKSNGGRARTGNSPNPSGPRNSAEAPPIRPPDASAARWEPTAQQLVTTGVTSKDAAVVAQILAEHAAGTPPSTIGRRLDVHHTTVRRILARAGDLAG
jgi:hypothetical protein